MLEKLDKFCVFCGKKPESKNKEHIIPKWLIELTGDPNRVVEFGPVWNEETLSLEEKKFAFDQFHFPACESCNLEHSLLEVRAKDIVQNLINESALSSEDFNVLLDWIDKIRVGLWLAYNYLQKNLSDIRPNYYISKRIGVKDRALFIYKSDSKGKGVTFSGVNAPAFQYYPICFSLRINHFCLFNLSTDFVVSKYLGLPYPKEIYFTDGPEVKYVLNRGKERVLYPIVRASYNKKCTEVYQPRFVRNEFSTGIEYLYDTDYSRSLFQNFQMGLGKILITENKGIIEYSTEPTRDWIPKDIWELSDLINMIAKQVLEFQIYYINRGGKYEGLSQEKKDVIKTRNRIAKYINRDYIKFLDGE